MRVNLNDLQLCLNRSWRRLRAPHYHYHHDNPNYYYNTHNNYCFIQHYHQFR